MKRFLVFIIGLSLFVSLSACSSDSLITTAPPEEIVWNSLNLGSRLPEPVSLLGYIHNDDIDNLQVEICNSTYNEYKLYLTSCINFGYTIDCDEQKSSYTAFDENGYKLSLLHNSASNSYSIHLTAPEQLVEIQWPTTGIATWLPATESTLGKIKDNTSQHFSAIIGNTNIDEYNAYVAECKSAGFYIDYQQTEKVFSAKNNGGYTLTISYEGNNLIAISLMIEINITVPSSAATYKGLNYRNVISELENVGFTNIRTEVIYDLYTGWMVKDGEVESVSINGNSSFIEGQTFKQTAEIVVTYHTFSNKKPNTEPTTSNDSTTSTVNFYTTNDSATAKLGNTGVYAYVMTHNTYNVYWVIDFDQGCAYTFTDQEGDTYCSKIKIESGTLNDYVAITYHADNTSWSQRLYFKYKNQPTILIMYDEDGFTHEYETTSLTAAWKLMYSKSMINY